MADNEDEVDASAALLGAPTGEESLRRDDVDELEFSAKQPKRPDGVSRAEYVRSGPGMETRTIMAMAGVTEKRRVGALVAGALLLAAAAGALVWAFIIRG